MKELLEYLSRKILHHPDDVVVQEATDEEGNVRLTLFTNPEDLGLAIGKQGKTANALRELLKIKVTGTGKRIFLDIKSVEELNA